MRRIFFLGMASITMLNAEPIEVHSGELPLTQDQQERLEIIEKLQQIKKDSWFKNHTSLTVLKPLQKPTTSINNFSLKEINATKDLLEGANTSFTVKRNLVSALIDRGLGQTKVGDLTLSEWREWLDAVSSSAKLKALLKENATITRSSLEKPENASAIQNFFGNHRLSLSLKNHLMNLMIKGGIAINEELPDGYTLFTLIALNTSKPEELALLLQRGADPNAKTPSGQTLLNFELLQQDDSAALELINTKELKDDTLGISTSLGLTPPMIALITFNDLTDPASRMNVLKGLITQENVNLVAGDKLYARTHGLVGHTLLDIALKFRTERPKNAQHFTELATYLLSMGAKVTERTIKIALAQESPQALLKLLFERYSIGDKNTLIPLVKNVSTLQELMGLGADIYTVDIDSVPDGEVKNYILLQRDLQEIKTRETSSVSQQQSAPISVGVAEIESAFSLQNPLKDLAPILAPNAPVAIPDVNAVDENGQTLITRLANEPGTTEEMITTLVDKQQADIMLGELRDVKNRVIENTIESMRKDKIAAAQKSLDAIIDQVNALTPFWKKFLDFFKTLFKAKPEVIATKFATLNTVITKKHAGLEILAKNAETVVEDARTLLLANPYYRAKGNLSEAGRRLLENIQSQLTLLNTKVPMSTRASSLHPMHP